MSDDWVPFSHRYGYAPMEDAAMWGGDRWRSRHSLRSGRYPEPELYRCICPSSPNYPQCLDRASQEDRLCDACRQHCVAVDDAGRYHRLIDVYGVAT